MNKNEMLKRILPCLILLIGMNFLLAASAFAVIPEYEKRVYYFYEVGNHISLSDFELGSDEVIRDQDGNGIGFSWVFKSSERLRAELDLGYSRTLYTGRVEDGVEVSFEPQAGEGYDVLSSSTNVVYDFNDVQFENPYIGVNFVFFFHMRIGGGRILQKASGDITLYASGIEIAKAEYEAGNQLYGQIGFEFNLDWLFVSGHIRAFEAPSLKITYCNVAALGQTVCNRIEGATGNRSLRSNAFGEGVLQIGVLF